MISLWESVECWVELPECARAVHESFAEPNSPAEADGYRFVSTRSRIRLRHLIKELDIDFHAEAAKNHPINGVECAPHKARGLISLVWS